VNILETYFTMQTGKAIYPDINQFRESIACLSDGFYVNRIEKVYGKRSGQQNKYYWSVIVPSVRDGLKKVGYECDSLDECHDFLKNQFIAIKGRKRKRLVNKSTGEMKYISVIKSTRKLSTIEFNEYFEKIIRWAAEYLSIVIPYPNE
jgi:hypothetical protein